MRDLVDAVTGEKVVLSAIRTEKGGIVPRGNVAKMVAAGDAEALGKLGLTLVERPPDPEPEPDRRTPSEKLADATGLTIAEIQAVLGIVPAGTEREA